MKKMLLATVLALACTAQAETYEQLQRSLPSEAHVRMLVGGEQLILTRAEALLLRSQMTILLGKLEGAQLLNQYLADGNLENVNAVISDMVQAYPTHTGADGTTVHQVATSAFSVISATPTVVAMLAADRVVSWLPLIGVTRYIPLVRNPRPFVWNNPRTWGNVFRLIPGRKDREYFSTRAHKRIGTTAGYFVRGTLLTVGAMVVVDEVNSTEAIVVLSNDESRALEEQVRSIISRLDRAIF